MIDVPAASDTATQVLADLEGGIGQASPILPKAFLRVLATTIAGAVTGLYRKLRWAYEQIHPQTASLESLQRIGDRYGLTLHPSVDAVLRIQIFGTEGVSVPGGSVWSGSNGLVYMQTALAIIGSTGTAYTSVTCLEGGVDGSYGVGNALSPATSIAGIDGAIVDTISTEGEDEETTEQFRARVMQRMAGQPQGGSAADYITWACQIPGIVRAFAYRTAAGTVTVYPLVATTGPARAPSASKLAEVLAYIDNTARRPLCATVLVAAPTERTVDITITTLNPEDETTKAAIIAELSRLYYAAYSRQYPDEENPKHVLTVAQVWAVIRDAGAAAASVTMSVSGTGEVTRYELTSGAMAKLGTVTWA